MLLFGYKLLDVAVVILDVVWDSYSLRPLLGWGNPQAFYSWNGLERSGQCRNKQPAGSVRQLDFNRIVHSSSVTPRLRLGAGSDKNLRGGEAARRQSYLA